MTGDQGSTVDGRRSGPVRNARRTSAPRLLCLGGVTSFDTEAPVLLLDADGFRRIVDERLPFAAMLGLSVESIGPRGARLRSVHDARFLRPGGTVAGPILMGLADAAMYAVVLSRIGPRWSSP